MHRLVPGMQIDPSPPELLVQDPRLFQHPVTYMHGKSSFRPSEPELTVLREYLQRGGMLLADATCGSEAFDRSFRELCARLFPEAPLKRIPTEHALFKSAEAGGTWFDLSQVTRREPQRADPNEPLRSALRSGDPFLEGVEFEGHYAIIYSPYDLSCALERSQSVQCKGYVHEDALRIAVNAVIYGVHYR
jgi:hypothetical protein